jgi:Mrp family chromosome partitioning ATPase
MTSSLISDATPFALAGLALALTVALALGRLDRRLRRPSQVEAELGVPVLGILPATASHAASSQACADLVARLELEAGAHGRLLMVVASGPRADAGAVATGLARQYSELGRRLLLVRADLRPDQRRESRAAGLTSLLSGCGTLEDTIGQVHILPQRSGNDRVRSQSAVSYSMLASGGTVSNPGALLGRPALADLLARAREQFDTVIIDCGAVEPVSKTAPLARQCDAILLVTESGRTRRRELEATRRVLGPLYAKVVGAALQARPRYSPRLAHPRTERPKAQPSTRLMALAGEPALARASEKS